MTIFGTILCSLSSAFDHAISLSNTSTKKFNWGSSLMQVALFFYSSNIKQKFHQLTIQAFCSYSKMIHWNIYIYFLMFDCENASNAKILMKKQEKKWNNNHKNGSNALQRGGFLFDAIWLISVFGVNRNGWFQTAKNSKNCWKNTLHQKKREKNCTNLHLVEQIRWRRGRKLTDRRLKAIKAKWNIFCVYVRMHIVYQMVMVIGVCTKSIIITGLELALMRELCSNT